ncbi:MAG: hypothetical protein IPL95_10530 [Saprospiraceae bacterium]|nr:hypothetical protein [Saprospiraceae bacterium]
MATNNLYSLSPTYPGYRTITFTAISNTTQIQIGLDNGTHDPINNNWVVKPDNYITSQNTSLPKCTLADIDSDGDGTPNRLETDSDNDGCTDAYESGTSTTNNATIAGPFGANGFADSKETVAESGVYNGTYTYSNATNATIHSCIVCNAGTTAPAITPTTTSNTCPIETVNLISLSSGVTAPNGSTLVWSLHKVPTSAGDTLTSTIASTVNTAGTYYAIYFDKTNNCYSPADSIVVSLNICCNIAAPTISGTTTTSGTATYVATSIDQSALTPNGGMFTVTYQKSSVTTGIDSTSVGASAFPATFTQTFNLSDIIPTDAIATPQPNFVYTFGTSNVGGLVGGLQQVKLDMHIDPPSNTLLAKNINWVNSGLTSYSDAVFKPTYDNTVNGTVGVGPLTTPAYIANTSTTTTLNGNWVTSLQYSVTANTQSSLPNNFIYPTGNTWFQANGGSASGEINK